MDDLPDWRLLLDRVHATFRLASMEQAADLVAAIARVAPEAAIDLRPPALVHIELRDTERAAAVSRVAADAGARSVPHASQVIEIAIDAVDIDAVRQFWTALLGYAEDEVAPGSTDVVAAISDPAGIGPPFWFQQMEAPRTERNRFHIDVTVPHDVAEERVAAALAAGGTLVTDRFARAWWVLADPEGNEACVCTWQDRTE